MFRVSAADYAYAYEDSLVVGSAEGTRSGKMAAEVSY